MISEPQIQYPIFYPCKDQADFESLDTQACALLGYPNELALDYCNPIISETGIYYFIINPHVSSLVDLTHCVPYDEIILPKKSI